LSRKSRGQIEDSDPVNVPSTVQSGRARYRKATPDCFLQGFQDGDNRCSTDLDSQMVEGSGDDDVRTGRPDNGRKRDPEGRTGFVLTTKFTKRMRRRHFPWILAHIAVTLDVGALLGVANEPAQQEAPHGTPYAPMFISGASDSDNGSPPPLAAGGADGTADGAGADGTADGAAADGAAANVGAA
jgi:hypothetical protein